EPAYFTWRVCQTLWKIICNLHISKLPSILCSQLSKRSYSFTRPGFSILCQRLSHIRGTCTQPQLFHVSRLHFGIHPRRIWSGLFLQLVGTAYGKFGRILRPS